MARYVAPKNLTSVFNNESYFSANISSTLSSLTSSHLQTNIENVSQAVNVVNGSDTLTLSDSLLQQHGNDLSITTDDGYILHLNNNKGTAGDLNINENSYHSNVNIVNGNLSIQNGYLNMGKNGTIVLNGADINAVLVGNNYQLSLHADTLANHQTTISTHAVSIQSATDVGVINSDNIIQIQQSYAPVDAPVFTTSIALPPVITVDTSTSVSSQQIGFLSNVTADVQGTLDTINSTIVTIQSAQQTDENNIQTLQTNLATVTSKQATDENNIQTLQTNLATVTSKQAQDESNIQSLTTNLATVTSNQ